MIKYTEGIKYRLASEYITQIDILGYDVNTEYISLSEDGWLSIFEGYTWDGASGCAIDDKYTIEPSLIHDSLYELMRKEHLPQTLRLKCDDIMLVVCKEKGMNFIRRWLYKRALKRFAGFAADPKNKKKIIIIP